MAKKVGTDRLTAPRSQHVDINITQQQVLQLELFLLQSYTPWLELYLCH